MSTIAFIGLGVMGSPMACHLARAGHTVIGYNRSPQRAAALVGAGGSAAESIEGSVKDADVVATIVPDSPVVLREVATSVGSRGLVERRVAVIGVLCEDVVEGHGLQVAASDEVDQLRVAVGDGGQVGVDEDDLLRLKRFRGVSDKAGFVLRD